MGTRHGPLSACARRAVSAGSRSTLPPMSAT
jgi:hypothetical protein